MPPNHHSDTPPLRLPGVFRSSWVQFAGFVIAVLAIGLLIYSPVRRFDFIDFDDGLFVKGNPWLKDGFTWGSVKWAFTAHLTAFSNRAEYWEPLTLLSRLLDVQLFGADNPGAFHASSVAIHLLNALLLGLALARLTGKPERSAVVAMLFLVHPMNVEPVCWLSARKDLLNATFFFCTLLAYSRFVRRRTLRTYLLLLAAFMACLMAKPMGVTAPFILLLLDWWPLGQWQAARGDRRATLQLATEKLPLLIMAGVSALLTVIGQSEWKATRPDSLFPLPARVENALISYATYLRRLVWPNDLALLYPHPGNSVSTPAAIAAGVLLICVTILAYRWKKRWPFLLAGWLWFLLILGPVIGLIQVGNQAMADRYAYLSTIGVFIAVVWGAAQWRPGVRIATATAASVAIAALAVCAARQALFWRNSVTIFSRAAAVTDNNVIALVNLGDALQTTGEFEQARAAYQRALQSTPGLTLGWLKLADLEQAIGLKEEAFNHYLKALRLNPDNPRTLVSLSGVLKQRGKVDQAERLLLRARELSPDAPAPFEALAEFYREQGRAAEAADVWKSYQQAHARPR